MFLPAPGCRTSSYLSLPASPRFSFSSPTTATHGFLRDIPQDPTFGLWICQLCLQVFSGFSGLDMNFWNSSTSVSLSCSSLVCLPFHLAFPYDLVLGRNYLPHVSFDINSTSIGTHYYQA
jgi:hypothetical protein